MKYSFTNSVSESRSSSNSCRVRTSITVTTLVGVANQASVGDGAICLLTPAEHADSAHCDPQIHSLAELDVAVETVVVVVVPSISQPVTVSHAVVVIVSMLEVVVEASEVKYVESVIVSVHCSTVELSVQDSDSVVDVVSVVVSSVDVFESSSFSSSF